MKRLLAAIVAVAGFLAVSQSAQAGIRIHVGYTDYFISGHTTCGHPIYTKRVCRGFDRYRRPIYSYYRQPVRYGYNRSHHYQRSCRSSGYRHHGYHSYSRGHVYGRSYHGRHPNSYRYSRSRCR